MIAQCLDRIGRGLFGRIQKSQVADQHHVALVGGAKGTDGRRFGLLSDCQHAETVVVKIGYRRQDALAHLVVQLANAAVDLGM